MGKILAVMSDLMFSVKILDAAKASQRKVEFVKSPETALEKAREKPDLIVLDLNCSEMDAVDFLKTLKADPDLREIRTLGFVSHVQEGRKRDAVAAGCDEVVARSVFSDRTARLLAQ